MLTQLIHLHLPGSNGHTLQQISWTTAAETASTTHMKDSTDWFKDDFSAGRHAGGNNQK
jgi:hypothetical protein